jgi:hypothetical protein
VESIENPFAPPTAALGVGRADGSSWRDGKVLVTLRDAELPPCCVKCGQPVVEMKRRSFYWHHPALYLIALCALLVYLIVAIIVRRKATVTLGLCAEHRRRRRMGIAVGWGSALAGIALAITGGSLESCGLMSAGLLIFLGGIIAGMFMARVLYPERIDKDFARLKGCGEAFLAMLPEFHG